MDGARVVLVPCGKCPKCLRDRQNGWMFRLQQEIKDSLNCQFVTLTYETTPKSFNGHGTLQKSDLQKFFKKLRKICPTTTYIKKNGSTGKKKQPQILRRWRIRDELYETSLSRNTIQLTSKSTAQLARTGENLETWLNRYPTQ